MTIGGSQHSCSRGAAILAQVLHASAGPVEGWLRQFAANDSARQRVWRAKLERRQTANNAKDWEFPTARVTGVRVWCPSYWAQSNARPQGDARRTQSPKSGVAGLKPCITTSGTRAPLGPTSNDAGGPSPIADLFANADRGAGGAAPARAALRSPLWTAPGPRRAPLPSTTHRGLTDGDWSLVATSLFLTRQRLG